VAESRPNRVVDAVVLLVKRFDRDCCEAGYRRNRMVSAPTLPQAEDGATGRGKWSDLLFADGLRRINVQTARIFDAVPSRWGASLAAFIQDWIWIRRGWVESSAPSFIDVQQRPSGLLTPLNPVVSATNPSRFNQQPNPDETATMSLNA
jgi:hypothetical protein